MFATNTQRWKPPGHQKYYFIPQLPWQLWCLCEAEMLNCRRCKWRQPVCRYLSAMFRPKNTKLYSVQQLSDDIWRTARHSQRITTSFSVTLAFNLVTALGFSPAGFMLLRWPGKFFQAGQHFNSFTQQVLIAISHLGTNLRTVREKTEPSGSLRKKGLSCSWPPPSLQQSSALSQEETKSWQSCRWHKRRDVSALSRCFHVCLIFISWCWVGMRWGFPSLLCHSRECMMERMDPEEEGKHHKVVHWAHQSVQGSSLVLLGEMKWSSRMVWLLLWNVGVFSCVLLRGISYFLG